MRRREEKKREGCKYNGKLETVEDEKEEQIITREKAEKLIESKQY
jgi:hypothetical protein